MSREQQLLLLALAALFHHARLTRGTGCDATPEGSFQEAHDFLEAAQKRLDMENLLR